MISNIIYPSVAQLLSFSIHDSINVPDTVAQTTLYVKQHRTTGLMYFGKTTSVNASIYKGSGLRWLRHLNKHGNDVSTVWTMMFDSPVNLMKYALLFSSINDIVESDKWANLEPENGLDGAMPGARLYIDAGGKTRRFVCGEQPQGWSEYSALSGKRMYKSPEGVIKFLDVKPEGWVEYSNVNSPNIGKRLYSSQDGELKYFDTDCQPRGWTAYSALTGKVLCISPDGTKSYFSSSEIPAGWVSHCPVKGKANFRSPSLKVTKRFVKGTEPEGFYAFNTRWGYNDKSITE